MNISRKFKRVGRVCLFTLGILSYNTSRADDIPSMEVFDITEQSTVATKPRTEKKIAALQRTQSVWREKLSAEEFNMLWPIYMICYDRQYSTETFTPEEYQYADLPENRLWIRNLVTGSDIRDPRLILKDEWGVYLVWKMPFTNDIDRQSVVIKQGNSLRLYSLIEFDLIVHDLCKLAMNNEYDVKGDDIIKCISRIDSYYTAQEAWTPFAAVVAKDSIGSVVYTTKYLSKDMLQGQIEKEITNNPDFDILKFRTVKVPIER